MNVYVSELGGTSNHAVRNALNRKFILLYEGITSKSEKRGLHHESLSVDDIEENQEFMLSVLRAAVFLRAPWYRPGRKERRERPRKQYSRARIVPVMRRLQISDRASKKALQLAQDWLYSY